MVTGRGAGEEGLDVRPWEAGVDASFVVDLLWPLSFQPEEAAPWIGDILERATMAERRLPVLAAWARRWQVRERGGDELPLVHARWIYDVVGDGGRGGGGAVSSSTPPVAVARRHTSGPLAEIEAPPRVHASRLDASSPERARASASGRATERDAEGPTRAREGRAPATIAAEGPSAPTLSPRTIDAPSTRAGDERPRVGARGEGPITPPPLVDAAAAVATPAGAQASSRGRTLEIEAVPGITRGRPASAAPEGLEAPARAERAPSTSGLEGPTTTRTVGQARAPERDDAALPLQHVSSDRSSDAPPRSSAPGASTPATATATVTATVAGAAVTGREPPRAADASPAMAHVSAARPVEADGAPTPAPARTGDPAAASTRSEARPLAQARASTTRDRIEVPLVDALDRSPSATPGRGSPVEGPTATPGRARVQGRRAQATARPAPRVHPRPGATTDELPLIPEASTRAPTRPRVHADAPPHPQRGEALEHLSMGPRAESTPTTGPGATQFTGDEPPTITPTVVTPAPEAGPPSVDVDALVTAVKRRLAREIRWERELRRAIG